MKEVLKKMDWSKTFLVPLTGLKAQEDYEMKSYLYWRDYSIHDYKLILSYSYDDIEEFTKWCHINVFPILDKKGYLLENYDVEGRSIFILDMSEWAMDIQMFILGKYSKFSKEAKTLIRKYHLDKNGIIDASIYGVIFPYEHLKILEGKTFLEYISSHYGLDQEEVFKVGEGGSIYDKMSETLLTDVEELCQTDVKAW